MNENAGMYVVVVTFRVASEAVERFRKRVIEQARISVESESGCVRFDVCEPEDGADFLLYEVYADRAAFDVHLASDHFRQFDDEVRPMVKDKQVTTWHRVFG